MKDTLSCIGAGLLVLFLWAGISYGGFLFLLIGYNDVTNELPSTTVAIAMGSVSALVVTIVFTMLAKYA